MLEAFDELRRDHPHARLVLAGSHPQERNPDRLVHSWVSAEQRNRALRVLLNLERDGAVERLQWVDHAGLRDLYCRADAFVMPTHAEGFGFTNVEAMSYRLPIITSTAGPAAEIVADGQTGLLVPPGDRDMLREGMTRLVSQPVAAREMADAGRRRFLERFTLERFRDKLRGVYDEALGR